MKTKIFKKSYSLILLFALLLTSNSCSDLFQNPMKDKSTGNDITLLLLDLNFFKTKFQIHILNAETEEYVDDSELNVKIVGKSAQNIVDYLGEWKEVYTTTTGVVGLVCDPNVEVSVSNPIEFEVEVYSDTYFAFPTEVYAAEEGVVNVYVYAFSISPNKSASITSSEPFGMNYTPSNGMSKLSLSEAALRLISSNYSGYEVQSVYENGLAGSLKAENFTGDPLLYSEWGFHYYKLDHSERSVGEARISHTFSSGNYIIPAVLKRNNIDKCYDGISLTYSHPDSGTTSITYLLTLSDDRIKKGLHSGTLPSFLRYVSPIYYSTDKPSGILKIFGDCQYNVEPDSFIINNVCSQNQLNVTLTPKDNLTHCIINYIITCSEGQIVGAAITYNIQIRKHNSNESWSWVESKEGSCELWLERGTEYDVRFNWEGEWSEFSFITSTEGIEEFLESHQNEQYSFWPTEDNPAGLKIVDEGSIIRIDANIQYSGKFCDLFK